MEFLTRLEAITAAMNGKKIRSASWDNYCYIYLIDGIFFGNLEVEADPYCTPLNDEIQDWELYEEPKQNEKFSYYEHKYLRNGSLTINRMEMPWERMLFCSGDKIEHLETIEHHYEKINGKWEKMK